MSTDSFCFQQSLSNEQEKGITESQFVQPKAAKLLIDLMDIFYMVRYGH
jgi:hypothetical protein